jgi:nucleotide-binding universal stress UspA family protein
MTDAQPFHLLLATDGSTSAKAALAVAVRFPWPTGATASVVVSRQTRADYQMSILLAALDRSAEHTAGLARRGLAKRWPSAETRVVEAPPVDAIVGEATRIAADVVVVGWRGHGAVRRLLAGSVSRGVVKRAPCPVLVVGRAPRRIRHMVLGFDGSPNAQRAVALLASLEVPPGAQVTMVTAVDTMQVPAQGLAPASVRSAVSAEVARINKARRAQARAALDRATAVLVAAGWKVMHVVTDGAPLLELLRVVTVTHADLLVVGATGVSGVSRFLMGSVAEGALNRSPVPVLIVR